MPVRLSVAAQLDVFQIALDGLDMFGPVQTERYEAGLTKTLDFLSRNPQAAQEYGEYEPPVRICPYQAHIIIYRVDDDGIFVVRICHAREDWTRFA